MEGDRERTSSVGRRWEPRDEGRMERGIRGEGGTEAPMTGVMMIASTSTEDDDASAAAAWRIADQYGRPRFPASRGNGRRCGATDTERGDGQTGTLAQCLHSSPSKVAQASIPTYVEHRATKSNTSSTTSFLPTTTVA